MSEGGHTVEPRNSNSEGKRKTVRVIGVNFSEILIKPSEAPKENIVQNHLNIALLHEF